MTTIEPASVHALYQGIHGLEEDPAELIGIFTSASRAVEFKEMLSNEHTELKRIQNNKKNSRLDFEDIPDMYWDIRPVILDPRSVEEV